MQSETEQVVQAHGQSGQGAASSAVPYRSPAERRAAGKTLRDAVPRADQSGWKPPRERRDPVELVLAANEGRLADLVPIRHGRMVQSPFAFYRGTAMLMAADLAHTPSSGLRLQACGDAHLSNFGGFATPERDLIFDINDLDETLPGALGMGRQALDRQRGPGRAAYPAQTARVGARRARRGARLPGTHGGVCLHAGAGHLVRQDHPRTLPRAHIRPKGAGAGGAPRRAGARRSVAEHDFPKLAAHVGATPRITDNPPLIFHLPEQAAEEESGNLAEAWALYRESLPEHTRVLFDRFQRCDMAVKVVGVGSVGTLCLIALFMAADDDPLFLQIKQANASILEPYAGQSRHSNRGHRVVVGQRLMQSASDIFLGWTQGRGGRHFYVRQLRDMKLSALIESFDDVVLREYAAVCGWALAPPTPARATPPSSPATWGRAAFLTRRSATLRSIIPTRPSRITRRS